MNIKHASDILWLIAGLSLPLFHAQVIDTPGVPDTDPNKTLGGYDKIIEHVRRSPSLNAIIFLVVLGRKQFKDYSNYRVLLRQFYELPCPKVIVCRYVVEAEWKQSSHFEIK